MPDPLNPKPEATFDSSGTQPALQVCDLQRGSQHSLGTGNSGAGEGGVLKIRGAFEGDIGGQKGECKGLKGYIGVYRF